MYDKFGLVNVKVEPISNSRHATYIFFKITVPSDSVTEVVNKRNWPRNVYVRKFNSEKRVREDFREEHRKTRGLQNRVIWNRTARLLIL